MSSSNLNKYFSSPAYDHPKLRKWKSAISRGTPHVEFWRERDGLSYGPASLYFRVVSEGKTLLEDDVSWDARMDEELIKQGVKAKDEGNEAERFGFLLRHLFEPIIGRYGDGYFNSVLLAILRASDFSNLPQIGEVLSRVRENRPDTSSQVYQDCVGRVESVITRCGQDLIGRLGYDRDDAEILLARALAYYLDERFSVTNRSLLGLA